MQEHFAALDDSLRAFIEQDDHATLVLSCAPNDLAVPAKLLEAQGRQSDQHVFLLGVAPCERAATWMDQVTTMLQHQVEAAGELRAADDLPPWPNFPALCLDSRQPPATRLR
ncbi:MAG: hypothetical protein AAGA56_24085, partial [Myxococcota bacterium]